MTAAPDSPRPDTTDMFAVHQALRDSLGCAPQLVRRVGRLRRRTRLG